MKKFKCKTPSVIKEMNSIFKCSWNHEYFGTLANLQKTRNIHDSMKISKIEFISYIYILL